MLGLKYNRIEGATGSLLRRLLETMPHVNKLDVSCGHLDVEAVRALFQGGSAGVLGRLQSLCMRDSLLRQNTGQILSSIPGTDTLRLVHLDLAEKVIDDTESLARLLLRCEQLESLDLCWGDLSAHGVRALVPVISKLLCLKRLVLSGYRNGGAMAQVLPSLANRPPCLKYLSIGGDTPSCLVALTRFLNGTGSGCLEALELQGRSPRSTVLF
jgi:hypothetical protein